MLHFNHKQVTTPKLGDGAVTGAKIANYKIPYQTDNSNTISNTTGTTVRIQAGWGQKIGDGSSTVMSEPITFPSAFTTLLGIVVTPLGVNVGAAGSITTFTTTWASAGSQPVYTAISPALTGFTVNLARTSGAFGATTYYGYSWIAWGI